MSPPTSPFRATTSKRPLPPTHRASSSSSTPLAWSASPPPSPSRVLARLSRRRPQTSILIVLLCAILGLYLVGTATSGGDGVVAVSIQGVGQWRWLPESWRVRKKASEGLIKPGGRAARNESYKTNLLDDVQYLTAFHISGLNNQVLVQLNLLHLAFLLRNQPGAVPPTPYTPLLPPFFPHFHHLLKSKGSGVEPAAPVLRFSQVFNIDRLAEEIGFGLVEWSELKDGWTGREADGGFVEDEWVGEAERQELAKLRKEKGGEVEVMADGAEPETMGCWSSWMVTNKGGTLGMRAAAQYYNIRHSLTPLPPSLFSPADRLPRHQLLTNTATFLSPPNNRLQTDYLSLNTLEAETLVASWGKNQTVADVWGENKPGWVRPGAGKGEVTCIDMLYFASDRGEEIRESYKGNPKEGSMNSGPWATIGRHAHWNADLLRISVDMMRDTLGLPAGQVVPDVLTVHIRRTDMLDGCPDYAKPCYATSHFANHIASVRSRLPSSAANWPVLVTTDETSPAYLAEIAALGWIVMDHAALRTSETYGVWYPSLVDNVVLSLGKGFVGTGSSTMSILAARRVQDWNGGETEMVDLMESVL